jgi:integrase
MNITRRGSTFYLVRRVPRRYQRVETRTTIWISLHTDSESEAQRKAPAAWSLMEAAWEARLAGDSDDAERRYEAARDLAAMRGFHYLPAQKVAALPREERLQRMEAVLRDGEPDRVEASALLGGVEQPAITVSRALELFWTLARDRTLGKSEDQLRRWKNPRIKAVRNFLHVVGDKAISEITPDDVLEFRQWWIDRIEAEGLTANSANKDFTHLADMLKTVNRMKRLGLVLPFTDVALKEGEKRTRPPFSVDWIRTRLMAPGALDGLNTQARCLVLGMINTGYRPSESAGLLPEHIRLDTDIPHISIEPAGRQLKNTTSKRVIPLAGVSLEAFRACPDGFPAYRGKDKISATVNKYLRENGLLETPAHSLYGLRHSFEDRMIAAHVDERVRRDLFGHAYNRERYGKGADLKHLHKVVSSVAL